MTEAGQGGGELIAGAAVQVAFNFGNAIGSIVGGAMLTTFSMNYRYTGLGGMPLALLAVGLLAFYSSPAFSASTIACSKYGPASVAAVWRSKIASSPFRNCWVSKVAGD